MTDYKLVPYDPTPEMVSAAEDAYMPFGDMDMAIRMAILAAPTVQGEPEYGSTPDHINDAIDNLAHANYELSYSGYKERTRDVELIRAYVARARQLPPQPAEQQTDVTQLVEALEDALTKLEEYTVIVEGEWGSGRDIAELEADNELPECIKDVRAALAAHRKQGSEA